MGNKLVLATRKSPLALAQAALVAAYLGERYGAQCELLKVVTTGDKQVEWSLEAKGGKGLFTKELEAALIRKDADLAIHSAKDLPGEAVEGLAIAGYLPREDPRDTLILRSGVQAPRTIATGSPRRRLQARRMFADAEFTEIRGNVDTRLKKIADLKVADATILAAAGLKRLGIASWPGVTFHSIGFDRMVPAVGQGAIAVQCRSADAAEFSGLFDLPTAQALAIERALQGALGAGCHTALGIHATAETLHFFHEDVGMKSVPLTQADFANPGEAAVRILGQFGLR